MSANVSIVTRQQFWLCTLGLFVVWAVVIASAEPEREKKIVAATSALAVLPKPRTYEERNTEKEMKHARNCKALCEHCGCLGFYCGEECICECNNENSDTQCIAVMQRNARNLAIPFEILIQGPTANHFVRNALQFEQNAERKGRPIERPKRSTVTIYKPRHKNALDSSSSSLDAYKATALAASSKNSLRRKRAVPQLDWFTDLANTLVRPAPLDAAQRKEEAAAAAARAEEAAAKTTAKRGGGGGGENLDRSWFTDSTKLLLRPAPLFKRSRFGGDDDNSKETPAAMRAVEKIPQVLKDTLRNIKEAAIVEDFTDAMRTTIKDGREVLEDNLQTNFDFLSANNLRTDIGETISKLKRISTGDLDVLGQRPAQPTVEEPPKYMIPWFRPVRFLRRVQQAIN